MDFESSAQHASLFVLQLGLLLLAVRVFGRLAKKAGVPQVLGELIAGIIIGPYALGGISFPGFPHGIFPLGPPSLEISAELNAFATIASVVLLFISGLETNLKLFLRYSLAGSLISIGGVIVSITAGALMGMVFFQTSFMDPKCLFLGVLISSNSLGIIARHLADQKKMDTPEGVTILATSVFDDVNSIILLTVVLGLTAVISGGGHTIGLVPTILANAGRTIGICLGAVAIGLLISRRLASILKLFNNSFAFSILALSIALILAGVFEMQGLAMIIGAYIAGLSFSKTDIAPVIEERLRGIYELLVPVFFAVMGMMVNIRDLITPRVLIFGFLYSIAAIIAKVAGCGGFSLLMGFNLKGALRIGAGMSPRGEMTLIIAGIALAMGILDHELFAVVVLMILITTLAAPLFLTSMLKIPGSGTRKQSRGDGSSSMTWEFPTVEIADLVTNTLLTDLRNEGFYVQVMSVEDGLSQARKEDISLTIREEGHNVTIESAEANMTFVKTAVFEVIVELNESIRLLKDKSDPAQMKKELLDSEPVEQGKRKAQPLFSLIKSECTSIDLKGENEEEIIAELVDILVANDMVLDRDMVIQDVTEREKTIHTGMINSIAMPNAKTDGVDDLRVAMGIKKEGVDFGSMDGEKSRLFILTVSPKKGFVPHLEFLAALSTIFDDRSVSEAVINASSAEEAVEILHGGD
ncbi:MAG: cation:proton antiporter [Treponema sp.]|nr:cation:proton antiporter [Treponema sp.]